MRGRRAVGAALVACAMSACARGPVEEPAVWELGAPVDGSTTVLDLVVLGGGCHADVEQVSQVSVQESVDEVEIAAFIEEPATPRDMDCPAVGVEHRVTVELERPLGTRRLVDPACANREQYAACRGTKRASTR